MSELASGSSTRRIRRLAEMTTAEAADAVAASPVVLLPAGAFEQHGPGLPLATDLVRAEQVAERVADRLGGRAVIGPAVPVGVSPHHMAFAGTVTLTTTTLAAVLREYADSLHRHGWRKVLVITGHGGNNATLATVAQDLLTTHPDLQFAWSPLTALAADVVAGMGVSEVHGHSGEAETAQMLALVPHLVRRELLAAGTTRLAELDALGTLTRRKGGPTLAARYDQLSANGVLGDPRRATPEDGAALVDAIVARIADFVTEWLEA
jgi:creatinine amidohydrolase